MASPPPRAISGASGPSTAPSASVASAARITPGSSDGLGRAARVEPVGRRVPAPARQVPDRHRYQHAGHGQQRDRPPHRLAVEAQPVRQAGEDPVLEPADQVQEEVGQRRDRHADGGRQASRTQVALAADEWQRPHPRPRRRSRACSSPSGPPRLHQRLPFGPVTTLSNPPNTICTVMPMSARPIDPRLLRHASAARGYLILTVVLGLAGTGLILAQAGLLARLLAGAATGVGLAALAGPLIALALVLAGRAATSYGGEAAALRAAATVKSQLRRQLLDRLLRRSPASGTRRRRRRRAGHAGHPRPGRPRRLLRPLPAPARPGRPRAAGRAHPGRAGRLAVRADHRRHAAAGARVRGAGRAAAPGPGPAASGPCWPGSAATSSTSSRACPPCASSAGPGSRRPPSPS